MESDLSPTERRLWQAFRQGVLVDLRPEDSDDDDTFQDTDWGESRRIRAEVLVALLCGAVPLEPGQRVGLQLIGAEITGDLDLSEAEVNQSVRLVRCRLKDGIDLSQARTRSVQLEHCLVRDHFYLQGTKTEGYLGLNGSFLDNPSGTALLANRLALTGSMFCRDGFRADGEFSLLNASVGGQVDMSGAHLANGDGTALLAEGLSLTGSLFCRAGFRADGEVRLLNAAIGELDLTGAALVNPGGSALNADGLTVRGSVYCRGGFHAKGTVRLPGARIGSGFDLSGAHLESSSALTADRLTVGSSMFCREGFHAEGEVRLLNANLGLLDMTSAHLANPGGSALTADGLTVVGPLFCREGFHAEGEVRLLRAKIGSQLNMNNAHLENPGSSALSADGITVGGEMLCGELFHAEGEVRLIGASVGGQLDISKAHFDNPGGGALIADSLMATGGMICEGSHLQGLVSLNCADIAPQLDLSGSRFSNPGGTALNAESLTVNGSLFCRLGFHADGEVSLSGATAATLVDEVTSWPSILNLDGFTYRNLLPHLPARKRLDWLRRMGDYRAQPYKELAAYYRGLGDDDQARLVLHARMRAQTAKHPLWTRPWGWLQDVLVGYGYSAGRAFGWLLAAFLAGWVYFGSHHAPTSTTTPPKQVFNAALYSLDLVFPTHALGYASGWKPQGTALLAASFLTIFGWALAIAVVAGITRILSKD